MSILLFVIGFNFPALGFHNVVGHFFLIIVIIHVIDKFKKFIISEQLKIQKKQIDSKRGNKPVNQESQKVKADLGLSSALGLLTTDSSKDEEQIPMKRKKKKPRKGRSL